MTDTPPIQTLQKNLEVVNASLSALGLPQIAAVNPHDCLPAPVNARYMPPEMMRNLVENVKADKRLESLPLCTPDPKKAGKYRTISGNHRIDAAKTAKLEVILILVIEVATEQEIIKRQLSHNALTGRDNEVVLAELYASLDKLDDKYYAGLQDIIEGINPVSLSFRAGLSAEMSLIFMPEDIELTDQVLKQLNSEIKTSGAGPVAHVLAKTCYDEYTTALKKLKRLENIKNNAAAFMQLVKYAKERIDQIAAEKAQETPEQPEA